MQISITTPAAVAKEAQPQPDIVVVMDVLRATSTAVVLGERCPQGILLVPRPELLPSLPGSPSEYLVFSELTNEGFERVDNSPSRAEVIDLKGRTPVLVTTNGTIATEIAFQNGKKVLLASFLNIGATAETIASSSSEKVMLVPAGKVSNDTRAEEDDQCALALQSLLKDEEINLSEQADQCRHAPLIVQRLLDEDGLLVDVDYALRANTSNIVLRVEREDENVFRIVPEKV